MQFPIKNKSFVFLPYFVALIVVSLIFINSISNFSGKKYIPPPVYSDEHQYLAMSINIFEYKIISHDDPRYGKDKVAPAWYREPLYPILLSLSFNFIKWDKFNYKECIYNNYDSKCNNLYKTAYTFNLLIYFLIFFSSLIILHKKIIASFFLIFIFCVIDPANTISNFAPELLSSLILIIFSYTLYLSMIKKKNNILFLILSGFSFAALIYIKNIFYYLSLLLILISFFLLLANFINIHFARKLKFHFNLKIIARIMIISLLAIILVLPYQIRNLFNFGETSLTKRGPEVLTLRNEFLNFSYEELNDGFIWYLNNFFNFKDEYIKNKIIDTDFKFYEQNDSSFYRAYNRSYGYIISRINNSYNKNFKSVEDIAIKGETDLLTKFNIETYLRNIPKQIYISLVIFFRGINNHSYLYDNYSLSNFISDTLWYFIIFNLIFTFFLSIIKKNLFFFITGLPSIFFIFAMSSLTQFEPRFSYTIIHFCVISSILYLYDKKN